ncbi:MAG: hypothetical protein BGO11_12675 [Solirubrobacterales bacterium 70-9]|nr:MAG: hypothetical protein BGO11_12675 [Solirubrobacterales bacterium 70-9]
MTSVAAVTLDAVADDRLLLLRPVWEEARPSPWSAEVEVMLCDLCDIDGEPAAICTRAALGRAVEGLRGRGLEPRLAAEFEFSLYEPENGSPAYESTDGYGVAAAARFAALLDEIQDFCQLGIAVESCHVEYGAGQFEVNLGHRPALEAIDHAVLLRASVGEVARRHGLRATFMGKPWTEHAGNGMHLHQSLWEGSRNLFHRDGDLSELGRHYLAGLLGGIEELSALGSPTPNSYRRRQTAQFTPVNASWGFDNRTAAVRVLAESEAGTRLEQRDAAADCNPYLAAAGQLTAGAAGLDAGVEPPPPVSTRADRADLPGLPRSLEAAAAGLRTSTLAERALGPELAAALTALVEWELGRERGSVGAWERDLYMDRF